MMKNSLIIAAIGDVHGEAGLLATMLAGLGTVARNRGKSLEIIFLGDIVDRGADSRGALDLVGRTMSARPNTKLLIGNHDWWLLQFLRGELAIEEIAHWLDQGGAATLASYDAASHGDLETVRTGILQERPEHLFLLENALTMTFAGQFAFAHAGVDPRRPIDQQDLQDCMWIRSPFLNHVGHLSHIVVHGHQPQEEGRPVVTENRISMDTGAVFTGRLSALIIDWESGHLEFVAATPGGRFGTVEPISLDRGLGTVLDRPIRQGNRFRRRY